MRFSQHIAAVGSVEFLRGGNPKSTCLSPLSCRAEARRSERECIAGCNRCQRNGTRRCRKPVTGAGKQFTEEFVPLPYAQPVLTFFSRGYRPRFLINQIQQIRCQRRWIVHRIRAKAEGGDRSPGWD